MITRKSERTTEMREAMRGGAGAALLTPASKQLPANARLFSEIRLAPGSSIGYHVHENETEMFLFLEGEGRVMDDDTEVLVHPGDSMATFSGHGHSVESIGARGRYYQGLTGAVQNECRPLCICGKGPAFWAAGTGTSALAGSRFTPSSLPAEWRAIP